MGWLKFASASLAFVCALAVTSPGRAAAPLVNNVPGCYAPLKLRQSGSALATEVFILVDQTVTLDDDLKRNLLQNSLRLIAPGSAFTIVKFSAFSQGRYMDVVARGVLEPTPPAPMRNATGVRTLARLDACLAGQAGFARKLALAAMEKALAQSSTQLARSDILASLKDSSFLISGSTAPRKVVLIASDMLENSSVSSFYENGRLKLLDPNAEMRRVEDARMLSSFNGARVFVLGAALISPSTSQTREPLQTYRDPIRINALRTFWTGYVRRSGGELIEFGAPALLRPAG